MQQQSVMWCNHVGNVSKHILKYGALAWCLQGFDWILKGPSTTWRCQIQAEAKCRDLLVYLNHSRKKKSPEKWIHSLCSKQNKSYQSSILTPIIIWITSAIIPTITTIINKTTNTEHPPHNIRGTGGYGLSTGHGFFQKKISSKWRYYIQWAQYKSVISSNTVNICNTVDQLCRIIAAKKNNFFLSKTIVDFIKHKYIDRC